MEKRKGLVAFKGRKRRDVNRNIERRGKSFGYIRLVKRTVLIGLILVGGLMSDISRRST